MSIENQMIYKLQMSLDQQAAVLMKKTQMSGDSAGSQCGLTALLPMSCRGRAAAFARDLHSRLRNLGTAQNEETEGSRLTHNNNTHKPTSPTQRDHDTFFDYELEHASPPSPVGEFEPEFERSPTEEQEPPFYDGPSELEAKEQSMLLQQQSNNGKNGFRFSTAFYTDFNRPVKLQPVPRQNGHLDRLFSPITFEGCVRQNSVDEVDNLVQPAVINGNEGISLLSTQAHLGSTVDSDSEFESAKSDPSECSEEVLSENLETNQNTDTVENLSLSKTEVCTEDELIRKDKPISISIEKKETIKEDELKVITTEILEEKDIEKEVTLKSELETSLLNIDAKGKDQDEDDRPERVRRCSSLKTGKTPPSTPGRKKIVRFADRLGLDLADVKTFMDEIPVIPKSAYDDLTGCDVQSSPPTRPTPRLGVLTLVPLFQLPRDFTDKLEKQNVCLESARVCDGVHVTICGSVRVRNLDFHKTVHIRYTMNRWKTYTDLQANYVQGSCDGFSDRFQFILYTPCISSGQRLEIAVRFQCKGQQFWDNNSGANYCFDCLALGAATQQPPPSGPLHPLVDWHPSFY